MAFTRKNVWELGGDWADPILWYARGVKAMKERALKEPTGWRFYGGIHGFNKARWEQLGYLKASDQMPSTSDFKDYWTQCQHGSWYFLPWHRGYLIAFEAVVRDAVVKLHGPADWALPYWNYFKQDKLPPAFGSKNWPDGNGDNPLFVEQRYGPNGDGNVFVPLNQVNMNALGDPDFTGTARGGSPGFGGVNTGFSHGGRVHGGIETQPHDWVHGLVGGQDEETGVAGVMSDPDTAGLVPIFWLHHANIDRLWEVWRKHPPSHVDPMNQNNWVKGPAAIGQRAFMLPMPGNKKWTYTPGEMSDLSKLDYDYDDTSAPPGAPQLVERLQRLGAPAAAAAQAARSPAMARTVELLGANNQSLRVSGAQASATVTLDAAVKNKVTASLQSARAAAGPGTPDRVFLNLENVRGLADATAFNVYINVPEGADPTKYSDHLAGSFALFGVRKATMTDDKQVGDGLTFVLEITNVVDKLHLDGALAANDIHVQLVPVRPVSEAAQVSIGRISIYRQAE